MTILDHCAVSWFFAVRKFKKVSKHIFKPNTIPSFTSVEADRIVGLGTFGRIDSCCCDSTGKRDDGKDEFHDSEEEG